MDAPLVTIKHHENGNRPFSEVFIDYKGQRFYSRNWWVEDDTPANRNVLAHQFLARLQHSPSGILEDLSYDETQNAVAVAVAERDSLIEFAASGGPPRPTHGGYPDNEQKPKRPALSLVSP